MIKLATEPYQSFIDYLNDLKFTNEPVEIVILPTCVTICSENNEDDEAFAVYSAKEKLIYVGGSINGIIEAIKESSKENIDKNKAYEFIFNSIAHEYKHHLQNVNHEDFNENDAEKFAFNIVKKFLSRK